MLAAAHGVISQLHMLRISKSVSWVLQIPVLSVSCREAMTLVIKPCALIPDSVHMCCTLVPGMLCHPSHGTDCPKCGKVLRLPLRSYRLYNRLSQFRFDKGRIARPQITNFISVWFARAQQQGRLWTSRKQLVFSSSLTRPCQNLVNLALY